ncbi:MAG: 2'-5' RNA ligase family protein [Proteobacteria bacterium]|nr:2'-5' RNA ligase family protein [Pseudomonadota bacterium]
MSRKPRRKFGASQKDRIFFACLPDAETAARIYALAETIKAARKFEGVQIRPEHLHVTLFHLGDWNGLPADIVTLAGQAAAQVATPAFDVTFNRTESFRNRTGIYPFVMTADKDAAAWRTLHTALGEALKRVGLGGATQGEFKPHVTLLRDGLRAPASPVVPISWTVREFVLVHSLLGKTTHIHLARWRLQD